ncbi:MBL fold metallo-hydrolase [Deinococcus sp.]|uniref:MBL fold metallo-hydrolase n=1 Tax=Deinococcus sp. TaxID=47478 RepID=UPI0025C711FF|nr:MBL fold metallo-hydrolase [Deinococcus sp.]
MTVASRLRLVRSGVASIPLYANVYLLRTPQGRLLVDTGTINHAPAFARLLSAFDPDAVLVTHGHLDHAGNAFVAARLGYPVLAHPLEHDRLSGRDHNLPYPAGQPWMGAPMSRMQPKVPAWGLQAALPETDLLGWQVIHLPGHTGGQVGLLRDGVLLAADAVIGGLAGANLPREAYNSDHAVALQTLKQMTQLELSLVLPGHGTPLTPDQIRARAERDD